MANIWMNDSHLMHRLNPWSHYDFGKSPGEQHDWSVGCSDVNLSQRLCVTVKNGRRLREIPHYWQDFSSIIWYDLTTLRYILPSLTFVGQSQTLDFEGVQLVGLSKIVRRLPQMSWRSWNQRLFLKKKMFLSLNCSDQFIIKIVVE